MLIVGALLMYVAFSGQDWDKLQEDLRKAQYSWVIASLAACFAAHVVRAIRWRMMIGSLGHGYPTLLNTTYAVIIGYMANVAFPRMGEISRCGVIHKTNDIPVVKLIGTVIVERIVDLLMLCIVIALAIFLQFDLLTHFIYDNVLVKLKGNTGNLTMLFLGGVIFFVAVTVLYLVMKKKKWGIKNKLVTLLLDMKSGILSVKDLDNKTTFIFNSVLIWLLYGLSTYLCFFALESTAGLAPLAALSVLVFSSLGMIVPVQGGIGAFHLMVSEGLLVYSIPKSEGLAYALLIHSSQTLLVLITGAISLVLLMFQKTKTKSR